MRNQSLMEFATLKYYILLVLAMVFWGGSWVSAQVVVSVAPPFTVGFFRFLTASLIFLPILLIWSFAMLLWTGWMDLLSAEK